MFLVALSIGGQNYEELREELRKKLKLKVPSLFKGLSMRNAFIQQKSETLLFVRVLPKEAKFRVKLGSRYVDLNDPTIKRLEDGLLIPILPNLKQSISVSARGYMTAEEEVLVKEGGVENLSITLNQIVARPVMPQ